MTDVNIEKLQARTQALYGQDFPGGLRTATGINSDPNGICRFLWNKELNACYEELTSLLGGYGIVLDGAGDFISTPDHASLDITGDFDLRIEWFVTTIPLGVLALINKWQTSNLSYGVTVTAFNTLGLDISTTGTGGIADTISPSSIRNVGPVTRVTLDANDGGGNHVITYFRGPTMTGPWTQLAQKTIAPAVTLFSGTATVTLGSRLGTQFWPGKIIRAQVRNGIDGTIVGNFDATQMSLGQTSYVDSTGKTWTLQGDARVG